MGAFLFFSGKVGENYMSDGRIIIDTSIDNSGAEKGIGKLGSIAKTGLKGVVTAVALVSTALIGFGGYAVKVGVEFESGMSKVKAISGATSGDMEKLADKAKEMGSTTKFSATESADALQYMALAGWKTNDMLDGLPGIMNLAAASGEELGSVSDIVTDSLSAFGMKASESGHFADVLAKASSNSNTNVAMLGESFKYVAPLAGALGYSVEDTSVALGLMANAGIKSSQSGTSLKTALVNLAKPTSKMKAVMDKYGLSLTNADGTMKPLNKVTEELRTKLGGLDKATQAAASATLFGKESLAGMLAVVNASPEDYEKLTGAINDSEGAAAKMAETMNDNLGGQVTLLKSALEGLGIQFYESVDNPLKDIVKSANGMIGELSKAFTEGGFSGLVESLGGIFAQIITGIATYAPKIIDGAILVIQSFVTGIQDNLPAITTAAVTIITSLVTGILTLLPQLLEMGLQIIINLALGIAEALPTLIPLAVQCIMDLVNTLIENLPLVLDAGLQILNGLVDGILTALPQLIAMLPTIIASIVDFMAESLPIIIETGITLLLALIDGLVDALPQLIAMLPQIIDTIIKVITENLPIILNAGITLLLALIKGLVKALPQLIAMLPQIINTIIKVLTENLPLIIDAAVQIMIALIGGLIQSIPQLIMAIPKIVVAIVKAFGDVDWGQIGIDIMLGIGKGIGKGVKSAVDAAKNAAGNIKDSITGFFGIHSPSTLMRDLVGVNLAKGIGVGFEDESQSLQQKIQNNLSELTAKIRTTVDQVRSDTSMGVVASHNYNNTKSVTNNTNDNGVTQNVTIIKPVSTASENARELKKVGRDLANGYI